MNNHGNFIVSLGALCRWLAEQAEVLGVDVFPGFPAAEAAVQRRRRGGGVRVGDMGVERRTAPGPNFAPGVDIRGATPYLPKVAAAASPSS